MTTTEDWQKAREAGESVKKETERRSRSWSKWIDRRGWKSYEGMGNWSRRQFRAALKELPAGHPDAWKLRAGALFADSMNDTEPRAALYIVGWVVGGIGSTMAWFIGFGYGISGYPLSLLWTIPGTLAAVYLGRKAYLWFHLMSR